MKLAVCGIFWCLAGQICSIEKPAANSDQADTISLEDVFLVDEIYKVGFLTVCGNPLQWSNKRIEVIGYARASPGAGLELSVLPPEGVGFPSDCQIGVSISGNIEVAREITATIARAKWALVMVRGDFVVIGPRGVPPHLGSLNDSSVQILKLER